MRLPGESVAEMEAEAKIWELLSPWAGPDDVELVRSKVYTFRSLLAKNWRDRRILIAGDAAHVMPPFMGQGMCSGIRDAWNLAWKLGLVLDRKSQDVLLDTYQVERKPHVSQVIDLSIYLGKMICMPEPKDAEQRDHAFKTGTAPPPPPFSCLTTGLLRKTASGAVQPGAGLLSPHTTIRTAAATGRMDDVVGLGFVSISADADSAERYDERTREALGQLGVRYLALSGEPDDRVIDLEGKLKPFMEEHGWDTMVVRPDFYVYGGASGAADGELLVHDLLASLREVGVLFD